MCSTVASEKYCPGLKHMAVNRTIRRHAQFLICSRQALIFPSSNQKIQLNGLVLKVDFTIFLSSSQCRMQNALLLFVSSTLDTVYPCIDKSMKMSRFEKCCCCCMLKCLGCGCSILKMQYSTQYTVNSTYYQH